MDDNHNDWYYKYSCEPVGILEKQHILSLDSLVSCPFKQKRLILTLMAKLSKNGIHSNNVYIYVVKPIGVDAKNSK